MRQSLLPPIDELELAAKLLDTAADAILIDRLSLARKLVSDADIPEVSNYAIRVVGKSHQKYIELQRGPRHCPSISVTQ